MADYIGDMEFGIVKERQAMEKKIKDDLKLKMISPRTFNRQARDIERWVEKEHGDLTDKKESLQRKSKPKKDSFKRNRIEEDSAEELINSDDSDTIKEA